MTPRQEDQLVTKRVIMFYLAIMVAHVIGYLFGNANFGLVFLIGYGICEIFWPIKH